MCLRSWFFSYHNITFNVPLSSFCYILTFSLSTILYYPKNKFQKETAARISEAKWLCIREFYPISSLLYFRQILKQIISSIVMSYPSGLLLNDDLMKTASILLHKVMYSKTNSIVCVIVVDYYIYTLSCFIIFDSIIFIYFIFALSFHFLSCYLLSLIFIISIYWYSWKWDYLIKSYTSFTLSIIGIDFNNNVMRSSLILLLKNNF